MCTLGPTKNTVDDIWRMAWQEKSKTIVMLTNPTEAGKVCIFSYMGATLRKKYSRNFLFLTFQLILDNHFIIDYVLKLYLKFP